MPTPIIVPKVGVKVTEVTIVRWEVDDGRDVREGQPVMTIETDKVEVEVEAPASGIVRHLAAAGDVHPVGAVVGEIG